MREPKPGDIVDVEIRGARVVEVTDGSLVIDSPSLDMATLYPAHDVTVKLRAPQPQAGDVWILADGHAYHFLENGDGVLLGHYSYQLAGGRCAGASTVGSLNLTHARCVYPPERVSHNDSISDIAAEAVAVKGKSAMLRRFRDDEFDIWTETAPGSCRYECRINSSAWPGEPPTRDEVDKVSGPLTDLRSVPAWERNTHA